MNSGNLFKAISRDHRYGKVYNRNLPKWLKRDPDTRIPIVPSADNIHLFIMGGHAGRFSAFIPGWGHMNTPVLKAIDPTSAPARALVQKQTLTRRGLLARSLPMICPA